MNESNDERSNDIQRTNQRRNGETARQNDETAKNQVKKSETERTRRVSCLEHLFSLNVRSSTIHFVCRGELLETVHRGPQACYCFIWGYL